MAETERLTGASCWAGGEQQGSQICGVGAPVCYYSVLQVVCFHGQTLMSITNELIRCSGSKSKVKAVVLSQFRPCERNMSVTP